MRGEPMAKKKDIKKDFSELIKCINLRNIYIKNSKFFVDKSLFSPKGNAVHLKESFKISKNTKNYLEILCSFLIEVKNKKKIPVSINVEYLIEYDTTKKIEQSLFKYLIDTHIKLTIFPYLREFVNSTSTRMGISPIVLPLFKILPKVKKPKTK